VSERLECAGHAMTVLLTEERIRARIAEMGGQLSSLPEVDSAIAVVALRGGLIFGADLLRHLPPTIAVDYVQARSYGAGTVTSGKVELVRDVGVPVTGRKVLLLDDIADTGLTCRFLADHIAALGATTVHVVTLLDKPERRLVDIPHLVTGFTIPDAFVVGYGLDFDQRFRGLPFVAVLDAVRSGA